MGSLSVLHRGSTGEALLAAPRQHGGRISVSYRGSSGEAIQRCTQAGAGSLPVSQQVSAGEAFEGDGQGRCGLLLDPPVFSPSPSAALRGQRRPLPSTSPVSRRSSCRPGVCRVRRHALRPRSSCQARAHALQGSGSLRRLFLGLLQGLSIRRGRSQSPAEPGRRGRLPAALANRRPTPCTGRARREGRPPAASLSFPTSRTDPRHGPTGAPQEGARERRRASLPRQQDQD